MKQFETTLKRRILLFAILAAIAVVAFILLNTTTFRTIYDSANRFENGFIAGFQTGGFFFCFILAVSQCISYARALKNPEKLKKMYIEETDERTQLIRQKIGGIAFTVFNFLLILSVIIAGYYNTTVTFTLLAVTICYSVMRGGMKLYYNAKL